MLARETSAKHQLAAHGTTPEWVREILTAVRGHSRRGVQLTQARVRATSGVRFKAVQELLGHSTIQMTMRYAHLGPEVTRDAVNLLDRPLAEEGEAWTSRRR